MKKAKNKKPTIKCISRKRTKVYYEISSYYFNPKIYKRIRVRKFGTKPTIRTAYILFGKAIISTSTHRTVELVEHTEYSDGNNTSRLIAWI